MTSKCNFLSLFKIDCLKQKRISNRNLPTHLEVFVLSLRAVVVCLLELTVELELATPGLDLGGARLGLPVSPGVGLDDRPDFPLKE